MNSSLLKETLQKKYCAARDAMTGNNRCACALALAVLLLAVTLTGVVGPLQRARQRMADETRYMKKETALCRDYAQDPQRKEKRQRQHLTLRLLQEQLPERPDASQTVKQLYKKAAYNGVTIRRLKELPEKNFGAQARRRNALQKKSAASQGSALQNPQRNGGVSQNNLQNNLQNNIAKHQQKHVAPLRSRDVPLRALQWEAEFAASWDELLDFIHDIEAQSPYTRFSAFRMAPGYDKTRITVQAVVNVFFVESQG